MCLHHVQAVLDSHHGQLHSIWRVSNDMIARHGLSRKEVQNAYAERAINAAMETAMRLINGCSPEPGTSIVVEMKIRFNAMKAVQNRSEQFLAQYNKGDKMLRQSRYFNDEAAGKTESASDTCSKPQEQIPQAPMDCKYFPRRHRITGDMMMLTKSGIIRQQEVLLERERHTILAAAPLALLEGYTKEEIMAHISSVLNTLCIAAINAATNSHVVFLPPFECYNWLLENIHYRQDHWKAMISDDIDFLIEKSKPASRIEEDVAILLQQYNDAWSAVVTTFTQTEARKWIRNPNLTPETGADKHFDWVNHKVALLLQTAGVHFDFVMLAHEGQEAYPLWQSRLDGLFVELEARSEAFITEQADMIKKEVIRENEREIQESRMHLFRSLKGARDFGALASQ
ncbi:hypothetical protein EG328_005477 [Venturia inaequalis]|uniref:Uncharacterized protein n=1 Tax=Venturia inaequalis TaxID=5025 RepID=A0A8H3UJ68_VENIN|nr:hypothetical protein EG328_005477 [Venturia inaequalis]